MLGEMPKSDPRPVRAVVRYEDERTTMRAIDVLACGHKVACARLAGGKLRPHDEPCDECAEASS